MDINKKLSQQAEVEKQAQTIISDIQKEEQRMRDSIKNLTGQQGVLNMNLVKLKADIKENKEKFSKDKKDYKKSISKLKSEEKPLKKRVSELLKKESGMVDSLEKIKCDTDEYLATQSKIEKTLLKSIKKLQEKEDKLKSSIEKLEKDKIKNQKEMDSKKEKFEKDLESRGYELAVREKHAKEVITKLKKAKSDIETIHGKPLQHIYLNYEF